VTQSQTNYRTRPSSARAAVRSAAQDGIAYEADRTGVSRHGYNGGDDGRAHPDDLADSCGTDVATVTVPVGCSQGQKSLRP